MAVSIEIPTTEPRQVVAGDTWVWKKSLSDYLPSDNWTLSYSLVKQGKRIAITASDDNDDHLVEVAASTTVDYNPGTYTLFRHLTNSTNSDRYTEEIGTIEVLPDFATQTTGYDNRTLAKKMVDALEEALPDITTNGIASISVDGRSYTYNDPASMHEAYNFWLAKYNAEQRKNGAARKSTIRLKFSRA